MKLLLILLCVACNREALEPAATDGDLGVSGCGSGRALVVPCCGGMAPDCELAPDGGCRAPMQNCGFGQGGCYLPCTPDPPFCVDVQPECASGGNLCDCIQKHGGGDPCGGSCDRQSIGLPKGHIDCLCY